MGALAQVQALAPVAVQVQVQVQAQAQAQVLQAPLRSAPSTLIAPMASASRFPPVGFGSAPLG
jgi:hypothetical protein